jgi:hypothetical protein
VSEIFNWDDKTDVEIVQAGEDLARLFYKMQGHVRHPSFQFRNATHPQERLVWLMACKAFEELTGTDLQDTADNLEDEVNEHDED